MQIYHKQALISLAGVLIAVLVLQQHAAAHAGNALYPIPQTRLSSDGVSAILPFSGKRRDSVAVIHNDRPPSLLVFEQGPGSKPRAAPSLPIADGILDCVLASEGGSFFIFTRSLSLLAVSAQSLTLVWRRDVVFGARIGLDLERASIIPLNNTSTLVIVGSHSNGTVFSALVDTNPGARPSSVTPRFCRAFETTLSDGLHALHSFFECNTVGAIGKAQSLPITFSSNSAITQKRFFWNFPHCKKQADVYVTHGARFAAAFVRSSPSNAPQPLCERIDAPRSFAWIEQLRSVFGENGSLGLESLSLHLPCENCCALTSRTVFFPGTSHIAKTTRAVVTFANGLQPPLRLCHVYGIQDSVPVADGFGKVIVGGSGRAGRMGLISSHDIERMESRPRWQVLLSERPLFLHYSASYLRVIVVTKRTVVILEAPDGGVVASIPLEGRDENWLTTLQRNSLGRSQAGVPTGLVVERDGVVWFGMRGAELAVLGLDLQQIDLRTWPPDVLSTLLVAAVACGLSIFLSKREGEKVDSSRRGDLQIRDRMRGGSGAKTTSRAGRLARNTCPKTEAVRECRSEETEPVFGKKDL